MHLHLIVDNGGCARPLTRTVALCEALIAARAAELAADLEYYSHKLHDLHGLDPADRTGLRDLYRLHQRHIQRLLATLRG